LKIDVSDLMEEPGDELHGEYVVNTDSMGLSSGTAAFVEPALIKVHAVNTGDGLLFSIQVKTRVAMVCSRCLERFEVSLEVDFDELFRSGSRPQPEKNEHEVQEGEERISYFTGREVDLLPVVRENLTLALPMKPLCREECAGLCLLCGRRLEEAACDCQVDDIDPRWADLMKLL